MTLTRPARKKSATAFASLLEKVQRSIEPRLRLAVTKSEQAAGEIGPEAVAIIRAIGRLCERGGKRLRPALARVGAACVSPDVDEALVLEAGVSLELLQAYFLIHDDWMDEDEERRGGPTTHVELARLFGSKAQGARAAILAGDLAQSLALGHLVRLDIKANRIGACLGCFADMQTSAIYGQQLDIIGTSPNPELTYELKTASYTVRGPLRLGALLAGARPPTLQAIDRFSRPAGIAFQLRDDLIGVFGDPTRTGKPRGGDLTAGKNTWLVRKALSGASRSEARALRRVLGKKTASASELTQALEVLETSGARQASEQRIDELCREALAAIDHRGLTEHGRLLLSGGLIALSERDA